MSERFDRLDLQAGAESDRHHDYLSGAIFGLQVFNWPGIIDPTAAVAMAGRHRAGHSQFRPGNSCTHFRPHLIDHVFQCVGVGRRRACDEEAAPRLSGASGFHWPDSLWDHHNGRRLHGFADNRSLGRLYRNNAVSHSEPRQLVLETYRSRGGLPVAPQQVYMSRKEVMHQDKTREFSLGALFKYRRQICVTGNHQCRPCRPDLACRIAGFPRCRRSKIPRRTAQSRCSLSRQRAARGSPRLAKAPDQSHEQARRRGINANKPRREEIQLNEVSPDSNVSRYHDGVKGLRSKPDPKPWPANGPQAPQHEKRYRPPGIS